MTTTFVESCLETVADSAQAAERQARGRPRAPALLDALAGRKNILITTHLHPDPDALGSAMALRFLLDQRLDPRDDGDLRSARDATSTTSPAPAAKEGRDSKPPRDARDGSGERETGSAKDDAEPQAGVDPRDAHPVKEPREPRPKITVSIKGNVGGGINDGFVRISNLKFAPWVDAELAKYDAIILLDTQPHFSFSPLPASIKPIAVIDHHRGGRGRRMECAFCDVRTDVGATGSIVFSYFMELEVPIRPDLAATLLYAIESDLAGAAGTPGELDNLALSSLTLIADPRKLYQMRYSELPQSYYVSYAEALANARYVDHALASHLTRVESMEQPAVMADFLLRFKQIQWALVTALAEQKLILSLRTSDKALSAADVMRKMLRNLGEGGGHRTKAGGFVDVSNSTPDEIEAVRQTLWRRYLHALEIKPAKPRQLVSMPLAPDKPPAPA